MKPINQIFSFVNNFDFKGQMESPATLFSCPLAFGRTWGFHTIVFTFYRLSVLLPNQHLQLGFHPKPQLLFCLDTKKQPEKVKTSPASLAKQAFEG